MPFQCQAICFTLRVMTIEAAWRYGLVLRIWRNSATARRRLIGDGGTCRSRDPRTPLPARRHATLELLREIAGVLMEPVTLDQHGRFAIAVVSKWTFLVLPDHKPVPFSRGRELDCKKVKKLVIVEVNGNER